MLKYSYNNIYFFEMNINWLQDKYPKNKTNNDSSNLWEETRTTIKKNIHDITQIIEIDLSKTYDTENEFEIVLETLKKLPEYNNDSVLIRWFNWIKKFNTLIKDWKDNKDDLGIWASTKEEFEEDPLSTDSAYIYATYNYNNCFLVLYDGNKLENNVLPPKCKKNWLKSVNNYYWPVKWETIQGALLKIIKLKF